MRVFVDSSVLIEQMNGRRPELFDALVAAGHELCISSEVVSEYYYHYIGYKGGRSPKSSQVSRKIPEIIAGRDSPSIVEAFVFLPDNEAIVRTSERLMEAYNLLPNDALILAACLAYGIECLASFDADFGPACQREGVRLVSKAEEVAGSG